MIVSVQRTTPRLYWSTDIGLGDFWGARSSATATDSGARPGLSGVWSEGWCVASVPARRAARQKRDAQNRYPVHGNTMPGMFVGTRSGHVSCVERDLISRLLYRDSI
jgi:hypothetical protein